MPALHQKKKIKRSKKINVLPKLLAYLFPFRIKKKRRYKWLKKKILSGRGLTEAKKAGGGAEEKGKNALFVNMGKSRPCKGVNLIRWFNRGLFDYSGGADKGAGFEGGGAYSFLFVRGTLAKKPRTHHVFATTYPEPTKAMGRGFWPLGVFLPGKN